MDFRIKFHYRLHGLQQMSPPDVVRAQVPKLSLDRVFLAKDEIAAAVKDELEHAMSGFGFRMHRPGGSNVW